MKYSHAIVIGGGIAGLVGAKVLADYFEQVTIIDRDALPETAEYRKGVPQARHAHLLLKGGENALAQFFPGLIEELKLAGALTINSGSEMLWYVAGIERIRYDSELESVACSRPMLETAIRRRVMAHPKISFNVETEVTGLIADATGKSANGIRVRPRGEQTGETTLPADLIVDASGRESKAPEWLERLEFPVPEETIIDAFGGYASRIYEWPADISDWKMLYVQPVPPATQRGGLIIPLEGNRMHLTLIGMEQDYPPTDEAGFMDFARSLSISKIYDLIKHATPLSPISGFRKNHNRLRHYDQLPYQLANFLLLGDSVVTLNPMYGQGMTVAALCANQLAQCLSEAGGELSGLVEQFQKKQMSIINIPWQIVSGLDMQWSKTEAKGFMPKPDPAAAPMQNYMKQLTRIALYNPIVCDGLARVRQMAAPSSSLFRPEIVTQVVAELSTAR